MTFMKSKMENSDFFVGNHLIHISWCYLLFKIERIKMHSILSPNKYAQI